MEILQELHEYSIGQLRILVDILLAIILAGAVGAERERSGKPAGFRTNMIVGGSACLFVALSTLMVEYGSANLAVEFIQTDPSRILQSVILGVSFIGAGTIFKSEKETYVRFLTTAATLLFSAGIGVAVAIKQYVLAIGVTVLVLLINELANLFARKFHFKSGPTAQH